MAGAFWLGTLGFDPIQSTVVHGALRNSLNYLDCSIGN
jgi:hypothetical protein